MSSALMCLKISRKKAKILFIYLVMSSFILTDSDKSDIVFIQATFFLLYHNKQRVLREKDRPVLICEVVHRKPGVDPSMSCCY